MAEEARTPEEVVEGADSGDVLSEELNAQRIAARMGLEYIDLDHFEIKPLAD